MSNFDPLRGMVSLQIVGALLAIVILLMYLAYYKKPHKEGKK